MKFLLDTHAFLWFVWGTNLSQTALSTFSNIDNDLYLSAASYWEICIKVGLNKLSLTPDWASRFDSEITINSIRWLPVTKEHCRQVIQLPKLHNDPFDRLLIAQAQYEGMTLMTADANLHKYSISTIW